MPLIFPEINGFFIFRPVPHPCEGLGRNEHHPVYILHMKDTLLEQLGHIALRVRGQRPLVHYMPNWVTANDVANALLAFGASPIMAVARDEVADINSAALALNLGTPIAERFAAAERAGRAAAGCNVPIVVDPVGIGATPFRRTHVQHLLAAVPVTILRLNRGEAATLLGDDTTVQGVDAPVLHDDPAQIARRLAQQHGCVAAISGALDIVSDGERTLCIENGHALLTRITGTGCMVSGIVAACAAVEGDPLYAAAAALLAFGVAGELATATATGPGSLRAALFDALFNLDQATIAERGKVQWV